MIIQDGESRQALLANLVALGRWDSKQGPSVDIAGRLLATASDEDFPGSIIPRFSEGHFVYYVAADNPVHWRRLSPLVVAAVGITLSNFAGRPAVPTAGDEFERALAAAGVTFGRVDPVDETNARRRAAEALLALVDGVRQAGQVPQPSLRTTASLLNDFDLAIALKDRRAAEAILGRLKSDARLEGINYLFLEIEALASADAWSELWAADYFKDATKAFRPPRITRALLRATYWTQLDPFVAAANTTEALEAMSEWVFPRWGNLGGARPADEDADVLLPLLMACAATRTRAWITEGDAKLESWPAYQRAFVAHLVELGAFEWAVPGTGFLPAPIPSRDDLRAELIAAAMASDAGAMGGTLHRLRQLSPIELADVVAHPLAFRAWELLAAEDAGPGIRDWFDWAARLPVLDLIQAKTWAREAMIHAPVEQVLDTSARVAQFTAALLMAASTAEATTYAALPVVLDWLTRDQAWPRREFNDLYRSLLDVLLLSSETSQMVVAGVSRLAAAVLTVGIRADDYGVLCRDLGDWVGGAASVTTIDALADLGEMTIVHPAPDPDARTRLWGSILSAILPLERRLDPIQVKVLKDVDYLLSGGALTASLEPPRQDRDDPMSVVVLRGRVAVYTLVESVARRVKEVVELSAPGVRVDFATEKVGSDRLLALARDADVFAIDWSRAKHAATDFIRDNRGGRPVLFTSGSGSSSIAREILDALRVAPGTQREAAA